MTLRARLLMCLDRSHPAPVASAHCDGPCGVYDPASARIAAEAVLSMTRKILDLDQTQPANHNTFARFVAIKEEQAEIVKHELSVLWGDYFKPEHLDAYPELHAIFWKALKAASAAKQQVSVEVAAELLEEIHAIHDIFWATKKRDVAWVLANP
jgi:nickel superoxide dismutase